ncbi:trichohyalin-like isoform X2 [Dreissena polymorpha]|uniref:trichohyalin-like isoform X2 n=1 Tax=Dreissena polymorpha TaxID=45954 RepID=UPI0022642524|nr:trichohyalin-like isoform X2 [Dreissena polymorpha]
MAHFSSPVLPATFCEVTYDSEWFEPEDDRHLTPYRYSLMRNDTDTNSDTVSLTLPSYTYYEYLRSLYDCRTTPTRYGVHHGNAGGHLSELGRAPTWHAYNMGTGSELSRQAIKSEPTRIRPTYPFPSLHLIQQGGDSGDELEEEMAYAGRTREKLVWVDALNKWVPEKQLHPKPYMTFIGNPPTVDKQWKAHRELHTLIRNNEKREAIRRRAQELAEQRRQRKAYSTPLYTSISERKLKSRVQSSKLPQSTPVSPTPHGPRKDKAPPPKNVWEGEEKQTSPSPVKLEPTPPPSADSAVKKEIFITLVSPKPEETDQVLVEDLKDKGLEKKVTFTETLTTEPEKTSRSPSPKVKKKDENTLLEEQRLKDALEQQRQHQLQERERLLRAQQEVEEAHQARAREEERLRMQRVSNNLHKQPLSQRAQHHENYYENTMNAAAKKRKGKGAAAKSQTVKSEKAEKSSKTKVPDIEEKTATQEKKAKHKLSKSTVPKKAILAGMGSDLKPMSLLSNTTPPVKRKKVPEQVLPVTKPEEIEVPAVEPVPEKEPEAKPLSAVREHRQVVVEQRDNVKKEKRREIRRCVKKPDEKVEELSVPETSAQKVQSWIFGNEDFSEKNEKSKDVVRVDVPLPTLSDDLNPELIAKEKQAKKERRRKSVLAAFIDVANQSTKKLRKPGIRDSSYTDELQRLELAEERRRKQQAMFERLKHRKSFSMEAGDSDGLSRFEDYGFLAKFCIFTKSNMEMYRHAFEAVDDLGVGWLEGEDVMIALRGVNNRLTEAEEEYLYRVLELTGYKITHGADFKMFSVLAALSQRITMLDKWMKNLIGQMDFKALEMKMFKCKTLWECNVDRETNKISIDQLCVDLRAGGVSMEHELEVREKLAHLHALDLLDFLTYVPLFIMIHQSVVQNPLDDSRTK